MIIEGNQTEIDAMKEFHKGNRQKGLELMVREIFLIIIE